MDKRDFSLQHTTNALSEAQDAVHLIEQKERLEQAIVSEDAPLTLDTAKSLLESIFKTIIADRVEEPDLEKDFRPLYKSVREVLPLNRDDNANTLLSNLGGAIVHNVSELRNKFGAASHGDDGYYESPIDMSDAEMIAHVVDGFAGFVYRKHKYFNDPEVAQRIYYSDYPDFNSYLDGQYPSYKLELSEKSGLDISPSILFFKSDPDLYREMLLQFLGTEESDQNIEPEARSAFSSNEKMPEQSMETLGMVAEDAATYSAGYVQELSDLILFNEEVKASMSEAQAAELAEFVKDYALNRAGVDWEKRESLVARFRLVLRRRLIKERYSEAYIDTAVDYIIAKAKDIFPSDKGAS